MFDKHKFFSTSLGEWITNARSISHQGESGKPGERGPAGAVGPVVSTINQPAEAAYLILEVTRGDLFG